MSKKTKPARPASAQATPAVVKQAILNELLKSVQESDILNGQERTLALRNASDVLLTLSNIM